MAFRVAAKTGTDVVQPQNDSTYLLPDDVLNVIFSNLTGQKVVHSLLLTSRHVNQLVSSNNPLWGNLLASYFPHSVQEYENASNSKDVFRSLKNRDSNINVYKFRTCILKGHKKAVSCIDVQGNKFASGSRDGTVIMWDRNTRKILFELDLTERGPCASLVIHGDTLFCGSVDGTITTWNANTGKKEHAWAGHAEPVLFLAVRGNKLISVANDRNLKIWDCKKNMGLVDSLAVMGLVHSVAVHGNKFFIGSEKVLQVGDLENTNNMAIFGACNGHTRGVYGLTSQGDHLFSCTGSGAIKMWEISQINVKFIRDIQAATHSLLVIRDKPSTLIVKDKKIFCALDDIAVLDLDSGETLYVLTSEPSTTFACMQNGILISGCENGAIIIRDFNFPSLTSYDEQTLEKNLVQLDKITGEGDLLCNELHPNFLRRLQELASKSHSFKEAVLRVKIEVTLHLLLDRIHRGDQKRISELLGQPYWNELFLIDNQTAPLYKNGKKICLAEEAKNLGPEVALESLKKKEQAVLKFLQFLKKQ